MLPAVPPPCFSLRWFTEDGGLDPAGGAEQGPQASQDTPREGLCSEGSLPLVLGMEEEGGSWRGGSRGESAFPVIQLEESCRKGSRSVVFLECEF